MDTQPTKRKHLKKKVSFGLSTVIQELGRTLNRKKNKVADMTDQTCEEDNKANFSMTVIPRCHRRGVPGVSYSERFGCKGNNFGELQNAADVESLEHGQFVVTDLINNKLLVFSENGDALVEYTSDDVKEPWAVAQVGHDRLAVCCKRSKCVAVLNRVDGQVLRTFGQRFFKSPCGIAAISDTRVVVTDDVANKVSVHDVDTGNAVMVIGEDNSFKTPRYVTVASNGSIIISDTGNHAIKIFDGNGNFVKEFGKYGDGNGCFKFPHGVCVDQFDHIFVADHYNNRISVFDQYGRFSCQLVTADLNHPQGLTLTSDFRLLVTAGDLKATKVLMYKLDLKQNDKS